MLAVVTKAAAVKKGYDNLNPQQKKGVNIAGAVALLGALYMGYKVTSKMGSMFDFMTGETSRKEKEANENKIKNDFNQALTNTSVKPSLSNARAKEIAQTLYDSFVYWGTYNKQAYAALRLINNSADYILVSREYGLPRGRTLTAELYNEMDNSEMKIVREILSKINVKI